MEILIVHPKDENEIAEIKAFMQALNIDFEPQNDNLPEYVLDGVRQSRLQANEGNLSQFDGVGNMLR